MRSGHIPSSERGPPRRCWQRVGRALGPAGAVKESGRTAHRFTALLLRRKYLPHTEHESICTGVLGLTRCEREQSSQSLSIVTARMGGLPDV